jgi:uncharacterized membrane protein required for colicin V production
MISEPESDRTPRHVIAAGVVTVFFALTWFVVSTFVMHAGVADSLGEALGVALGFLVAFSVLGAVLNARGRSDGEEAADPTAKSPRPRP